MMCFSPKAISRIVTTNIEKELTLQVRPLPSACIEPLHPRQTANPAGNHVRSAGRAVRASLFNIAAQLNVTH